MQRWRLVRISEQGMKVAPLLQVKRLAVIGEVSTSSKAAQHLDNSCWCTQSRKLLMSWVSWPS